MKLLTAITDDALQNFSFTLDDGSVVQATFNYVPSQNCWFYSLNYPTLNFAINNMRIVNSPNMLRKFRRIIPFGLACTTIDGYEIVNLSDFVSGRASIFVLNQTDISQVETLITDTLPEYIGSFQS